jgi:hypothetical protein|tara:strand:+ start:933 stop:1106 length:174 start_codon:yes stop_codon:yes gene_type:complete
MIVMLFNMCNSNDFNRKACLKELPPQIIPTLREAWELKTKKRIPYQNEKEKLKDINI